uniref:Uncharacterized protein n=1 Tax=Astyanax mexicanus TaxID=7994 RepID=A0A3B1IJ80_ASTMX
MTYRIDQLEEGRNYFFRVVAENEHGIGLPAETPEPLKISEKPQPPGKISVVDVTRKSVSLSWEKPEHDGGSRISHYEVEMQAKDSEKWSLCASVKALDTIVTNLAQGEEYNFRVIAVNDKGKSDPRLLAHPVVAKDLVIDTSVRTKLSTYIGEAPSLKEEMKDTITKLGESGTLACQIIGRPLPEIKWYRYGKELTQSRKYKMSSDGRNHSLTVLTDEQEDEGLYICRAINEAGEIETTGKLRLQAAPQFHPGFPLKEKYYAGCGTSLRQEDQNAIRNPRGTCA